MAGTITDRWLYATRANRAASGRHEKTSRAVLVGGGAHQREGG